MSTELPRRQFLAATAGANVAEALELKRQATIQLLISGRVDEGLAALRSAEAGLASAERGESVRLAP